MDDNDVATHRLTVEQVMWIMMSKTPQKAIHKSAPAAGHFGQFLSTDGARRLAYNRTAAEATADWKAVVDRFYKNGHSNGRMWR